MPNENFDPLYSSDTVYRGQDDTRCITDDLDAIEADITALENGKSDIDHTHSGYAPTNHTHSGYADVDHEHSEYALMSHTHSYNDLSNKPTIPTTLPANGGNADTVDGKHASDFASASDVSELQTKVGTSTVAEQISSAVASKADTNHTHSISNVTGLSDELDSKYEKPSTGIPKTDLASDIQTSLNKADTALQSISGYATEAYVDNKVAGIVDTAPEALNTLNELAAALGDDPNFATTVATQIGGKVDKVNGKDLSTNDYTDADKTKLSGIESGANKTDIDSELSSTSTNPVQNKVINTAISNLNTLVGTTSVSAQISSAVSDKADANHTHNYAGSSSVGGAATSADKLNTNAGNATQPVYFANGVPTATTYTLGKSVPDNAVFTDTTYSVASTSADGLMSAADKTKLNGIATGANNYSLPTAGSTLGGVKTTSTVTSNSGYTACPIISGVPYYKDTNTTYSSLKNPYALTMQFNGTTNKTYDGSSAQTFNVTPSAIGVADYVVAQGTSGNWRYRKWNSGVSEAWYYVNLGTVSLTNCITAGIYANNSYISKSVSIPSGVFSDIPSATANMYSSGYTCCIVSSATKDTVVYRLWSPYSTTATGCQVSIHMIGKWK